MRSPAWAAAVTAAAAVAATTVAITGDPAGAANSTDSHTVSYAGTSVTVPASWPVYDLTAHPQQCVRFDRHAVYLGHPGTDQRCPSHLIGRTSAVLIEPYDGTARTHVEAATDGTVQRLSSNGKAMITVSYGGSGVAAANALLQNTPVSAAKPQAAPIADPHTTVNPRSTVYTGLGFDTCAAPSQQSMKAWGLSSPYNAIGIYVGGVSRACGLGNLNHFWVSAARSYGFHFIPTYVGRQAPCTGFSARMSTAPKVAHSQGTLAGMDAVRAMRALGFGPGAAIYIDIEQYDGDATCSAAVVQFVSAWSAELHRDGYVSGFYSSQLQDVVAQRSTVAIDSLWIARWNSVRSVYGIPNLPDSLWNNHHRLHQYYGGHPARYGGVTLNIDSDWLDGPVG